MIELENMKTSEETGELFPALVTAWGLIETASKDALNPHLKNRYADLTSVMDAIKPHLSANKLMLMQPTTNSGAEVSVVTYIIHSTGQWLSTTLTMTADNNKPQAIGSAITYGRRYALSALLGIVSEVDDDGNESSGVSGPRQASAPTQAPRRQVAAPKNEGASGQATAAVKPVSATNTVPTESLSEKVPDPKAGAKATELVDKLKAATGCTNDHMRGYYKGCFSPNPQSKAAATPDVYLPMLEWINDTIEKNPVLVDEFKANPEQFGTQWAASKSQAAAVN